MPGVRHAAEQAAAGEALIEGKRRISEPRAAGPLALLRLQRRAGNEAATALLTAKLRSPGADAASDIDGALAELRHDEPAVEPVEKGLKAAKAAGVPVELEGPKPPPSALAVTKTGFGPGTVPAKKPVPPAKPVAPKSPLARFNTRTGPPKGPAGAGAAAAARTAPATPGTEALADGSGGALGPTVTVDPTAPPTPPTLVRPDEDPAFARVKGAVQGAGHAKRSHPPAASKAAEAQSAALAPADDLGTQAKAAKVDTMDAQPKGTFDKKAFITAVKAAIEAKSPKTLKEADNYAESGKAGEVKGEVRGLVTEGKSGQAKDIETATAAPPDQSKAVPKQVTPMAPEQPGTAPPVSGSGAAPKPAPADQLNLAAGPRAADQEMAEADVTDDQLAKSNEPEFNQALADKKTAAEHSATAPAAYRQQESQVIDQTKSDANAEATAGVAGMQSSKAAALAKLVADKGKTKTKDEAKRAEVTGKIQAIFTATETDVKKILEGIDPKVETAFTTGEAAARAAFEGYVSAKMSAYKEDRYSGWLGGLRWAKDKLLGMPDKVNEFYEAGRELYLKQMDGVISRVADIVGHDLTAAKTRIAKGKAEIAAYVKSLPADLKKIGSEASQEIGERFADLESEVDAKQESVVDTLATKYVEARKGLDERIEALQAENKGLVDKAIGAIKAVINTIRELVAMLKNVLARAAGVVGEIVKDPVGFLGNLIAGIKGGILKFKDNILDHLRKGLMSWLFGSLAEAGIELPDSFDLKGIIKLLASIFGLTWTNIRNRIVKQIGEKAMAAAEKGVEIFSIFATQGIGGLWQMLLEKLGDIKEMILEQVKDFVITKIITAGITWLIGLLNPAAAFIKACKLIYDVVMFFVNNGSRIIAFVNAILDSVSEIVRGNVSAVVNKIDDVLGQMVPIIIGFLASLIGLGGIGQKIREIVTKLQKPINAALDWVIKKGLQLAGPIIRGLKGIGAKVKAKVAAGKAWVKGKVEAGKAALLGLLKKPFSADGKSHTLSVNQSGKILIASAGGLTMEEHERGAKEAARATNRTDLYPTIEQLTALAKTHEVHFAHVRDQEVASLDRNDPKNKKHFDAIELITTMARELWTVIHYSGKPGEVKEENPDGIGNIAPHGQQKTPRKGLISEHVLPDKWLSNVFEQVAGLKALSNRQYQQMTTILIREGAAKHKTNEGMGDNTGIREILTGKKGVGSAGPSLVTRVDLTMNAIKAEHAESGRGEAPMPTRAAVSEAAALQMEDVVRFVRENSDAAVGAGADFEGSANLAKKAEDVLATTGKDDAIRGQFRTAMGALSTWLRTHSAQAPAPTRTQISALHDRLVEQRDLRWPAALAPGAEEKAARREVLSEAVRTVIATGRPVAEVARAFNVKRETLRDWVYRYQEETGG